MLKTRVTEVLGIEHPIVQSGIRFLARAELAAAVSNAGALGTLSAHTQPDGAALRAEIARTRTLTARPFAVNVTIAPGSGRPYDDYVAAIVESGVPVVETAGANPAAFIQRFKQAGLTVIHKCTSVRHALKAEQLGADIVSITGFEAAGHTGMDDVSSLILIPAAVAALKIPVLASGGFFDGRGLVAALALGAQGVNMGTRFMLTAESPAHEQAKRDLLAFTERDTALIARSLRDPVRVARTPPTTALLDYEAKTGRDAREVERLAAPELWVDALARGRIADAPIPAGMALGLIDDVPTCADLVARIAGEAARLVAETLPALLRQGAGNNASVRPSQ